MNKKEGLEYFRTKCWKQYLDTNPYVFRERCAKLRKFACGNQDAKKFKQYFDTITSDKENKASAMNVNWSDIGIQGKFILLPVAEIYKKFYQDADPSRRPLDLTVNAIDPESADQRAADAMRRESLIKNADFIMGMREATGQNAEPELDQLPGTIEEQRIYEEAGMYRQASEVEGEQVIDIVHSHNCFSLSVYDMIMNLVIFNLGSIWVDSDARDTIQIESVRPEDTIFQYSKYPDQRDAAFGGRIKTYTEQELRAAIGDEMDDTAFEKLQKGSIEFQREDVTCFGDYYPRKDLYYVIDFWFVATDTKTMKIVENKYGNKKVEETDNNFKGNEKAKAKRDSVEMCWGGKWVAGTDIVFQFSAKTDLKRQKNRLGKTPVPQFTYTHFPLLDSTAKSMAELIEPFANMFQGLWIQYQNAVNKGHGQIEEFPVNWMFNLIKGQGMTPQIVQDLITMAKQSGSMPTDRMNTTTQSYENVNPIVYPSTWGDLEFIAGQMERQVGFIRDVIGFNEFTDASTANPDALVGIADRAISGTHSALLHIVLGVKYLIEKSSDRVLSIAQVMARTGRWGMYSPALGKNSAQLMSLNPEFYGPDLGSVVQMSMSPKEEMELQQNIQVALESGQITIADKMEVNSVSNYKTKTAILRMRIKQNMERAQEDKMALEQKDVEAAEVARVSRQEEMAAQFEMEMQREQMLAAIKDEQDEKAHLRAKELLILSAELERPEPEKDNRVVEIRAQGEEQRRTQREMNFQKLQSDLKLQREKLEADAQAKKDQIEADFKLQKGEIALKKLEIAAKKVSDAKKASSVRKPVKKVS